MKINGIIALLGCLLTVSCINSETASSLSDIDDMVRRRQEIYSSYEMSLEPLKTRFREAGSAALKWELADSLHDAYVHFNLDSTLEYIRYQHIYSSTPKQEYIASLNEVSALAFRHNEMRAQELFCSLDQEEIKNIGLEREYLKTAITLYNYMYNYSHHISKDMSYDLVKDYRTKYLKIDSLSYYGKRTIVLKMKSEGRITQAIDMLLAMAQEETHIHNLSSIYYNLAQLYEITGNDDMKFNVLMKSVRYDFACPVRNYLSLYELALMMYDKGMLERAGVYISANLSDAIAGNFNTRMINSGRAQVIISEAANHEDRQKMNWLLSVTSLIIVMFIVMCVLFVRNRRHSRRLREIKNILLETNKRLKKTNHELNYANKIKDSYVFSYMELSIHYLEKIEQTRKEIRAAGNSGGLEQIMKMLRSPSEIYEEYKRYYQIFDEAFLGIFPDFVPKVNALLQEDARFPIPEDKTLCTELRMLAAIRLGIRESGQIATFLKCSPTSVYSYKSRLKRAAICPKDEFERNIMKL